MKLPRRSRSACAAPPALAERLLGRTLGASRCPESMLGDLHEEHARAAAASGRRAAALWYWTEAIRLSVRFTATKFAERLTRRAPPAPIDIPHGDSIMRTIALETRHAVRALRKRPLPTSIVVVTLALCLGANAAVFAIIDALVIRPFHFHEPDRIAFVAQTAPDRGDDGYRQETASPANFLDWRRQATTIEHLSAFSYWDVNLVGHDEPERVQGFQVSAGFFQVLGVSPAGGRAFTTAEETFGNHRRVVLGDGLWKRRFGADPSIVGQAISLNGEQYDVVGVAPADFDFPMGSQLWVPLAFDGKTSAQRTRRYLTVIGRLAPGRTLDEAQAEMATIARRLEQQHPEANRGRGARVFTLTQGMMDVGLGPILSMWQASALFVLLIGCANIANLLLARAAERERELAVRLAIGASRARVIRQLLVESVLLGLAAIPGALLAAHAGLKLLVSYMPARIARFVPGWHDIDVDGRLLAVTLLLALGTAIVFGLLPAWHSSRPRIADTLKSGGRSIAGSRNRLRRTLAIAEVALALPLLVAAGLSAVGVNRFLNGPQGYNPDGVLTMRAVLSEGRHPDAAAWRRFAEQAVDRLAAMPGIEAAAAANALPSMPTGASREIEIDGQALPETGRRPIARYNLVTPRLFDVMQQPVVSGRAFTAADRDGSQPVAIVSESLARRHWPAADPIGRRLRIVDGEWLTVVGVCGDVVHDWFGARNSPTLYRPYAQAPTGFLALAVRTSGDPSHAVGDAVKAIAAVDAMQPVFDVMTYRALLKDRTLGLQYVAAIMATFGVFALVLAVVGVYSVMACLVTQRTHEIGVRMALGATRADVMRLTVGQAGRLTAIGVAIGTLLAVALGRLIEAGLLGVVAADYRMVAGFGAVLVGAALVAGYLPARRAARIDPAVALRAE
jgi:putative ABC transport system permease protein